MYLASFCPPPALIIRILLPPLLYASVSACKTIRVGVQPSPLTLPLPPCLTNTGFTGFLPGPCPAIGLEITATVHASLPLLFRIGHPLSYENCRRLCGTKRLDKTTAVLLKTTQMGIDRLSFLGWFQLSPTILKLQQERAKYFPRPFSMLQTSFIFSTCDVLPSLFVQVL